MREQSGRLHGQLVARAHESSSTAEYATSMLPADVHRKWARANLIEREYDTVGELENAA